MRLSDIMSNMHLTFYPEIALVIFVCIFAAVMVYTWRGGRNGQWDDEGRMPLDKDEVQ